MKSVGVGADWGPWSLEKVVEMTADYMLGKIKR